MKRSVFAWLLTLCMMLTLCALAEGDLEEVSIFIFDSDGTVSEEIAPELEPTPEPTPDPAEPQYEADGSILLTMSFTGDFTIGENVQHNGTSIFEKEFKKMLKSCHKQSKSHHKIVKNKKK